MKKISLLIICFLSFNLINAQDPLRSEDVKFEIHKSFKDFKKSLKIGDTFDSTLFIFKDGKKDRIAIKQRKVWYSIAVPVNADSVYIQKEDIDKDKLPELIVKYRIYKEDNYFKNTSGGINIYTFKDRARQILDYKNYCSQVPLDKDDSVNTREYERKIIIEPGFILIYADESKKYKLENCNLSPLRQGVYNLYSEKFIFYRVSSDI